MDYFDYDSLESHIKKYKRRLLLKLEKPSNYENLQKQGEDLCQVLDYSPKENENQKELEKITFKSKLQSNQNLDLKKMSSSFNIDIDTGNQNKKNENENLPENIQIVKEIINKLINNIFKDENEENESDEDFEKLISQRNKNLEKNENTLYKNKLSQIHSMSKISNHVNESSKVRIYLLNTASYIDMIISSNETVKDLKVNIIKDIILNKRFNLKFTVPNAFEIRLVDDDDEIPNMDFPPLEDTVNVLSTKNVILAFVEKENYDSNKDNNEQKILGNINQNNNDNNNINIKVYFKYNGLDSSKIISLKPDDTLKNILEYLFSKDFLVYKNIDLYYFVEHKGNDDIDNAINIDTNIKYLSYFELDLYIKKFPDAPEAMNIYNNNNMNYNNLINRRSQEPENKEEEPENGREYFFNDISAGLYQEFEVVKINKYKNKQERILGIDMYNLYNNKPKKKSTNGIFNILFKETKKPLRKIKDIKGCDILDNKMFYLDVKDDEDKEIKRIVYEVKNNNIRNEIVAKLKFLIKLNQDNLN